MEYGAIDLHSRNSLIRIVDAEGAVIVDRTVATTREGLTRVFGTGRRCACCSRVGPRVGGWRRCSRRWGTR